MITQSLKHNAEMLFMLFLTLRKYQDVIYEDHDKLVQVFHENRVHQVHEVSGGVVQTKRHHQILVKTVSGGESSLWDIFFTDLDLMIARTKVNL
jgi:CDP-glycerol glycerophosphotransferase (TagB/SpsB family)